MKKLFPLFLTALLFLSVRPAFATILWVGGEDIDYLGIGGTVGTNTNSSCYNSGYARGAIRPPGDTVAYFAATPVLSNMTDFWLHFYHINGSTASCSAQTANNWVEWIRINDSSGTSRLFLQPLDNAAVTTRMKLYKRDAGGTATLLATSTAYMGTAGHYDIHVNYAVSGQFELYYNGDLILSYSGDLTTNSLTAVNQVYFASLHDQFSVNYSHYSEVILSTTDTRSWRMATIQPSANGNTMSWTGAVGDVNEVSLSDATAIVSGTADQLAQFTVPSLPTGSFGVEAVIQSVRASRGSTGPQNLQFSVRTGGSDYTSSSQSLTTSYANYSKIWSTNPGTSAAWTTSDIGAAGFNLGLKSKP